MRRCFAAVVLIASIAGACQGCTCGRSTRPPPPAPRDAGHALIAADSGGLTSASATSDASFSAPIGAVRIGALDAVAGLVVHDGVVRAMGLSNGKVDWVTDALRPAAWTPDAELRLERAGDGLALLWKGLFRGKNGRMVVLLGADGKVRGEPFPVGSAFCAAADGGAWVLPRSDGSWQVIARLWSDAAAREVLVVSPAHDAPSLVCAEHAIVLLGDDVDNLTTAYYAPGAAAFLAPVVAERDADFGDDEREHDAYSLGDNLVLVRVGSSGTLALRDITRAGPPTPWRRLKRSLTADDDVVAVDGDDRATLIVTTHDADTACPSVGSTAAAVRAIRVDRRTGEDRLLDLAPPDCDAAPGPFWIDDSPQGPMVSWVQRRSQGSPELPPIASLAYRVIGQDGVRAGTIVQPSDALVHAGCDDLGCSAAALVRPPGADATQPATIRVVHFP